MFQDSSRKVRICGRDSNLGPRFASNLYYLLPVYHLYHENNHTLQGG